jgi:hypothetical protein
MSACQSVSDLADPTFPKVVGAASLAEIEVPLPTSLLAAAAVLRPDRRSEVSPVVPLPTWDTPPLRTAKDGLAVDGIGHPQTSAKSALADARQDAIHRLLLYTGIELEWVSDYVHEEAQTSATRTSTRTRLTHSAHLHGIVESARRCLEQSGWYRCQTTLEVHATTVESLRSYARARRETTALATQPKAFTATSSVRVPRDVPAGVGRLRAERSANIHVMTSIAQQIENRVHVRTALSGSAVATVASAATLRNMSSDVRHGERDVTVTGNYFHVPVPPVDP